MSDTPYTTTFTGRRVTPSYGEPAILDVAVGLSRMTRFAGQGKQFFSVLAHMMWMDDMYQDRIGKLAHPAMRLAILLHDAGEAVSADIPSPHKSSEQRGYQKLLDERIYNRYFAIWGGWKGYQEAFAEGVKSLDYTALLTEFWEVGPAIECYLDKPDPRDRDFFRFWLEKNPPLWGNETAAQDEYIHRVIHLL